MKRVRLLIVAFLVLALLLLLGCAGRNAGNSRNEDEKSGSWEQRGRMVEEIAIAAKSADTVRMDLRFGAAEFRLRPANMSPLAEGQIVYYDHRLVPEIIDDNNYVKISQETSGIAGSLDNVKTEWNLNLSTRQVLDLSISAGAFDGEFDFSGLQLTSLSMATGAAEGKVIFNKRNPQKMRRFDFSTGASSFKLSGLLNADFEHLDFKGGAGSYTLDFGGSLQHDDSVQADISVGVCDLTIIVPHDVSTRVVMKGALTSVSPGSFLVAGSREYVNGAYNSAKPTLEIIINMSVGSLDLKESR
jgi:hypothetical protein